MTSGTGIGAKRMKLDALNQWLTLAANVGVLAGILFLAIEISQNSDAIQAQTRAQLSEQVTDLFSVNMSDSNYADVLLRGNVGQELSLVEQYQYARHRNAWIQYWNNVSYQYQMGTYDESEFRLQMATIRSDIDSLPGLKAHWCERRKTASQGLIEAIETDLLGDYC